jgi:uncharacterized repeat protein (TIGR04138 family)
MGSPLRTATSGIVNYFPPFSRDFEPSCRGGGWTLGLRGPRCQPRCPNKADARIFGASLPLLRAAYVDGRVRNVTFAWVLLRLPTSFLMLKLDFTAAVDLIVEKDPRFDKDAYFFLKDVLEYTAGDGKKQRESHSRHVTGQQLLEGVRKVALAQFGPMVLTVFDAWGVKRGEDFGEMVYSLIDAGFFRKSAQDSPEDFSGGYSFHEAFVVPFLPCSSSSSTPVSKVSKPRRRETKTLQD